MGSVLLTDKRIQNLRPKTKQYESFASKVRGLGIRVSPGGTKSFILLYRLGRLNRRFTLGSYGVFSLAEARRRAMKALSQVAKGVDPQSEKLKARENYQTNLFPEVANEFIENRAKRNTRSWQETGRILRNEFVRDWGKNQVQTITRQRIHDRLDEIVERNGPSAANHAFAVIRRLFNWCVDRGYLEKSPCAGMKAPAKTVERKRVLTAEELSDVIHAAGKMGYPFGPFTQILVLTGQRRDEVSGMRWRDLDLENDLWTQPEGSNKSEREHIVPLNRPLTNQNVLSEHGK